MNSNPLHLSSVVPSIVPSAGAATIKKRPLWHHLQGFLKARSAPGLIQSLVVMGGMSLFSACTIQVELPTDPVPSPEQPPAETAAPTPTQAEHEVELSFDVQVLDFGEVSTGKRQTATVYLSQTNPEHYPLGVTLVLEDGISVFSFADGSDATAVTLHEQESVPVTLAFEAPVAGVYEGKLSVLLLGSSLPPVELELVAVAALDDQDQDGFNVEQECDDQDPLIFPGQAETCNGIDDDCDGEIDDGVQLLSYNDKDGDGFGQDEVSSLDCSIPDDFVALSGDCNDRNDAVHPDAEEVCDGKDNDCDEQTDEGVTSTYFEDSDRDGYGDVQKPVQACSPGLNTTVTGDCNDDNAGVHPGAKEVCFGQDLNCDAILPTCFSCESILRTGLSNGSGLYTIDPDGPQGEQAELTLTCDMETAGGGWSLVFLKNSSHVGDYGTFGAAQVSAEVLENTPEAASMTVAPLAGWLDLNQFPFEHLRVTAYSTGELTYSSQEIPQSALRVAFGQPGYLLYGEVNGYYWCAGESSFTDEGVGQVNRPGGAPAGCKGHEELGSGWDFSTSQGRDEGLTLSGSEAESPFMHRSFAGSRVEYPIAGAAYALWVR